jgi:two-component system, NarL family, sensor histidine kinase LiaS
MTRFWRSPFQRVRWRLTLSYLFVALASIFILTWWGVVVAVVYLVRVNSGFGWVQVVRFQALPLLGVVLPSAVPLVIPAVLISAYFGFLTARWFDQRLSHLRQAAQAWQQGDFSVRVQDATADEIGEFGQELNRMASDLQRLLTAQADLAALEERTHLSRDLHDSVKQHITAAAFQIGSAQALLEQNPSAARASLDEAGDLVHTAHQDLNTILFELRPAAVRPGSLGQALRDYTAGWSRQNPIQVLVHGDADLPDGMQQELLRFVQEALSNVARHSGAHQAAIELRPAGSRLFLTIRDDGVGFQPDLLGGEGYGLRTMRERIQRVGGELELHSQPGQGTRLTAAIPIPARE